VVLVEQECKAKEPRERGSHFGEGGFGCAGTKADLSPEGQFAGRRTLLGEVDLVDVERAVLKVAPGGASSKGIGLLVQPKGVAAFGREVKFKADNFGGN